MSKSPVIYTNRGIEVEIFEDVDNSKELLKECEENPKIKYALALRGEISFIRFKRGASMLSFYQNIIPNYYQESANQIKKLTVTEKGKLPRDNYLHGWSENHWKIYEAFRFPRRRTFQDIGIELGLNRATVKKYYEEVLEQSKIFTSFFPRGVSKYSYQVVLFGTNYEIGILKALKKFNRTSYLYKFNDKILLGLFLGPNMKTYEKSADHFAYLEEIGMIHDLRVSVPRDYTKDTL